MKRISRILKFPRLLAPATIGFVLLLGGVVSAPTAFAIQGDCGQPSSVGPKASAADALFVLRAAVGLSVCTPACICDVDAKGGATAGDALLVLRFAVGLSDSLNCPANCGATTTTSSSSSTTSSSMVTSTTMGPSAIERGRILYDLECAGCHKAGSYDTRGFAGDLAGRGEKMRTDLGVIDESMDGLIYSADEVADFVAFLESL